MVIPAAITCLKERNCPFTALLTILSFFCVAFVDGEDPDQDYIDAALPIIEEHMMLGAHRLAALMVDIYGSSERAANFIMQ